MPPRGTHSTASRVVAGCREAGPPEGSSAKIRPMNGRNDMVIVFSIISLFRHVHQFVTGSLPVHDSAPPLRTRPASFRAAGTVGRPGVATAFLNLTACLVAAAAGGQSAANPGVVEID